MLSLILFFTRMESSLFTAYDYRYVILELKLWINPKRAQLFNQNFVFDRKIGRKITAKAKTVDKNSESFDKLSEFLTENLIISVFFDVT